MNSKISIFILSVLCGQAYGHDTTHIHPLITLEIAKLIKSEDVVNNAYADIYEPNPKSIPGIADAVNFLYWGTDLDPLGIAKTKKPLYEYLAKDQEKPYLDSPIKKNVITGVVYEDFPFKKVEDHFYHGETGAPFTLLIYTASENSAVRAMRFYSQAVEKMGHYSETSKQEAFFLFGQSLHHVEDMMAPAHMHNDAENALFAPMPCCGASQNTHVSLNTLRFFETPRLALNPTEHFHRFN